MGQISGHLREMFFYSPECLKATALPVPTLGVYYFWEKQNGGQTQKKETGWG